MDIANYVDSNIIKKITLNTDSFDFDFPFFENKIRNVIVLPNPCCFDPIDGLNAKRERVILAIRNLDRYFYKGFDSLIEISTPIFKSKPK